MSTSDKPRPGRPLWPFWGILLAAMAVTGGAMSGTGASRGIWPPVMGILGVAFWLLLFWSAKRGGWLKGLAITVAVLALAFGICVALVASSFE